MKVVTGGILMITGACTALGIIHFRFWLMERARRDELAFSIACFSVVVFAAFELLMMHAATPTDYLLYMYWGFLLGSFMIFSTAWFAYINLGGRRWLFWVTCAWRLLLWIIHFILPNGINVREIKALGQVTVFGESLAYPIAVASPWQPLAQLGHLVLIVFCLDSSIRAWRRGERRKAFVFGTAVALFGATLFAISILVVRGFITFPIVVSLSFLFVIVAMVYELDYDMQSSAILSKKLIEREATLTETLKNLNLSASAASVGMYIRKIGEETIWVSEKAAEIWSVSEGRQFTLEDYFQSLHPEDRERIRSNIRELEKGKDEFQYEYRMITKEGNVRWVESRGKIELVNGESIIRGAIVDRTKRKLAEEAVHELSRRLMNAQESERARLARELHDDLSQSLALLSIELSGLRKRLPEDEFIRQEIEHLVSQIAGVAETVRRIAHELHPSRLKLLGLEKALGAFCREIASAHSLEIDFKAENLPVNLPDDISLCLFRITQESLHNVVKHSGATSAHVGINLENDKVHLSISDNGSGFESGAGKSKESLGLISIDERARAVKGTVEIISRVGSGTKIEACVPVN